jgi:hypothetical protein
MATLETTWQNRSNWAAEQAAKLHSRFPSSELPWELQCGLNRDRMASIHLSWLELVTVSKLLGHTRLDTTARYTTPSEKDLEKAVEKLEFDNIT